MPQSGEIAPITFIDLRRVSHLFVGGLNIHSFAPTHTRTGSTKKISCYTHRLQESIRDRVGRGIAVQWGKLTPQENIFRKMLTLHLDPRSVKTPEELMEAKKVKYVRFPLSGSIEISDKKMDQLLQIFSSQPGNEWFHFYDKWGRGRASLLMAVKDILHNAQRVSFEAILQRQSSLGGIDFFDNSPANQEAQVQRLTFLRHVYRYAQEVFIPAKAKGEVPCLWSEWVRATRESKLMHDSQDIEARKTRGGIR